MTSSNMEDH